MTTTTSYGTWVNHGDRYVNHGTGYALTLEDTVEGAVGEYRGEFDLDALARDYRDAINMALPEDITLNGNEFYGPWPRQDVDIAECVRSVDLWSIIERHDNA